MLYKMVAFSAAAVIAKWSLPITLIRDHSLFFYKTTNPYISISYLVTTPSTSPASNFETTMMGPKLSSSARNMSSYNNNKLRKSPDVALTMLLLLVWRTELEGREWVRWWGWGGEVDYVDAQYQKREYACSWFKYITLHKSFCNFKVMNFHGWCKKIHMQICKLIMRRPHLQGPGSSRSNL